MEIFVELNLHWREVMAPVLLDGLIFLVISYHWSIWALLSK